MRPRPGTAPDAVRAAPTRATRGHSATALTRARWSTDGAPALPAAGAAALSLAGL
ncbi:hypothetical protein [Streptomyces sp. NPDC050264]|uniref:hypothetical protein n=1 Tax=Streptomyces sp. NPDC050264 TaxID=3155038 RepID=UPI003431B889